jgi:hypothetical protein
MHKPIRRHIWVLSGRFYRRPYTWWSRLFLSGAFKYYVFSDHIYKVPKDKVVDIEAETKKKSYDLTKAELIDTMRRLGINKLEVTNGEKIRLMQAYESGGDQ